MARAGTVQFSAPLFRGPPRRLVLLGQLPPGEAFEFEPDARLADYLLDGRRGFRVRRGRDGEPRRARLRLQPPTPPGTYAGTIKSGATSVAAQVVVEPNPVLTMLPAQLDLTGQAGDRVQAELMFFNRGNVPIDIPPVHAVGLFDDAGVETAFATTYRLQTEDPLAMIGHFVGQLRDSHGGLLKIKLTGSEGPLGPGLERAGVLETQLPGKLKPGHGYHGVWSLGPTNFAVRVTVSR